MLFIRKSQTAKRKYLLRSIVLFLVALLFFITGKVEAATLSINPTTLTTSVGNTITVRVVVGSGGQSINAISGQISFSSNLLSLSSISKNGVVTLWAQDPTYSNSTGSASFQGVILNGYNGNGGSVIELTFKAKAEGTATIDISRSDSSVLLNDGQGTDVLSSTNGATITIGKAATVTTPPPTQPTQTATPPPIVLTEVVPPPTPTTITPIFTDYQDPLTPGAFIVAKGTASPNTPITITFTHTSDNGNTTVSQATLTTTDSGEFTYVSDEKVEEGSTYSLVATTTDGKHTDTLSLTVKDSFGYLLISLFISLFAIKVPLVFALLFILLVTGYLLYRNRVLEKRLEAVTDELHNRLSK